MKPLDLRLILPQAHLEDIQFIQRLLQLNPALRLTAQEALQEVYFYEDPAPRMDDTILVPLMNINRKQPSKSTNSSIVTSVEEFMDKIVNISLK